ncbi:acyl-CoA thioesterase [Methanimicrococcus blatticola]|uniref:Acyl-CoA thioester hydrolase n=1 Tax=Methanimicrococcus blatticola TaxID=91560 RepID=A0A484F3V4_9EURY|nr:thioesterase family protein [Methanimicrococcus blatticola]MBZ3935823.1 acyl-CoA thioesterase [Methanimicrococcus blatticola]MCC2508057.1 acyl-CoA thioesterase [Methanimicrococcus blatticola]TDQ68863.1 acyl-CoA thioester hydrolase [Methanimicrococcus blatticola]
MFTATVTPSFGEVDGLGHINNTVLARWFEMARNPVFRIFEPNLNLSHDVWPLIMAYTDFNFVGEMFFEFDVELRTYIEKIGTKSFTIYHEAWQGGRLCTYGRAVVVHYDFKAGVTTPIPEDKKAKLAEHMIPEGVAQGIKN